jgi:GNAT superfamily N-acetyltransferase
MEIERLNASAMEDSLAELSDLLVDAVEDGASVGFLLPLTPEAAASWWSTILAEVDSGRLTVLVAREEGQIVGTVQLRLAPLPNARHRAEVAKLLVRRAWRRRGTARALMASVESVARELGRSLLVLDTMAGSAAQKLYLSLGWTEVGAIPDYAAWPDGKLGPTVIYYRRL